MRPSLATASLPPLADGDIVEETLERVLARVEPRAQPPLVALPDEELTVVLPALALGGAERIVVDWAERARGRYRVHIALMRRSALEHAVPDGVRVTLIGSKPAALEAFARQRGPAASAVMCHLLTSRQRDALRCGGAKPIPVIHNARDGWIDRPADLRREPLLIAVSSACATELRDAGATGRIVVIRHLPPEPRFYPGSRDHWRNTWGIPAGALVVGMIGGVKPQKAYPFAVRVLAALRKRVADARLVIVGGPTGRDGERAWAALNAQRLRMGLMREVVLAGCIPGATRCLPAFDVVLNTSHHEGLSIATLEALAAGFPVVASQVGGQGEVGHSSLALLPRDADQSEWAQALVTATARPRERPAWNGFSAWRQWTLAHFASPWRSRRHALFVTANLNAGGAQRSLVNLATALAGREAFTVAVTGDSTSDAFARELACAGVEVVRTAGSRDAFDHAEALLRIARERQVDVLAFWNVDPRTRLLVAKFAPPRSALRLIDVCPGAYAFEEIADTAAFQDRIAFDAREYYARLDRLVQKFAAISPPGISTPVDVIRNGTRPPRVARLAVVASAVPSIVVNGRIAPTKFLQEILAAFALVRRALPRAQLHVIGSIEPRHAAYGRAMLEIARADLGRSVFLHGPDSDAPDALHAHDVALVLGEHQGCPNACLEALAAGVPLVANDSGGTREIVIDGRTGWLLRDRRPDAIAATLLEVLGDPAEARRRALEGGALVARKFSMDRMTTAYSRLLQQLRENQRR